MSITEIDIRMKEQYENRTRYMLARRTYTIIRVDGRAFHTWTRGMDRPYSIPLMVAMDNTALALCDEIAGAQFAYIQSDEISVLVTDFAKIDTHAWFDNNLQKLCSISASVATAEFNRQWTDMRPAHFDARVFQIPDPVEVANYFVARQKDATRNSISMLAQHYCSPKELHGVSCEKMHDKIHEHGDNWANHPVRFKHGGMIVKEMTEPYKKQTRVGEIEIPPHLEWKIVEPPVFTQYRAWLTEKIPLHDGLKWEEQ